MRAHGRGHRAGRDAAGQGTGRDGSRPAAGPESAERGRTEVARGLGELGTLLLDAGYAVTDAHRAVASAADGGGRADIATEVFPTLVFVDDPDADGTRMTVAPGRSLTYGQVSAAGRLAADASQGEVPLDELAARVEAIETSVSRFPVWATLLGSGLMSAGIAVVFGAPWWAVAASIVLGMGVGVALGALGRSPRAAAAAPFFAALLVSLAIWALGTLIGAHEIPLFAVCGPLAILIPGTTITNAVLEVSGGDLVSGGGRLVSGLVTWALLAAGVLVTVVWFGSEIDGQDLVLPTGSAATQDALGFWAQIPSAGLSWAGAAAVAIGFGLYFSAPATLTVGITAVLLFSYAVLGVAQPFFGGPVAGGVSAGVTLIASRVIERLHPRWPSVVLFRPAFWLLVPGSLGLVTALGFAADAPSPGQAGLKVVVSVIAITIGIQIGALVAEVILPYRRGQHPPVLDPRARR